MADFEAVEEMNAEGPARKGSKAVTGLARGVIIQSVLVARRWTGRDKPRRANEATVLIDESIMD